MKINLEIILSPEEQRQILENEKYQFLLHDFGYYKKEHHNSLLYVPNIDFAAIKDGKIQKADHVVKELINERIKHLLLTVYDRDQDQDNNEIF